MCLSWQTHKDSPNTDRHTDTHANIHILRGAHTDRAVLKVASCQTFFHQTTNHLSSYLLHASTASFSAFFPSSLCLTPSPLLTNSCSKNAFQKSQFGCRNIKMQSFYSSKCSNASARFCEGYHNVLMFYHFIQSTKSRIQRPLY